MYRLLETRGESRERRDQLVHPPYQKPELLATQANQLWSWDITKLRGPAKWTTYHLYVILDVFSRYVVGLDDRVSRKRRTGPAAHSTQLPRPEYRLRPTHPARRIAVLR